MLILSGFWLVWGACPRLVRLVILVSFKDTLGRELAGWQTFHNVVDTTFTVIEYGSYAAGGIGIIRYGLTHGPKMFMAQVAKTMCL